MRRILFGLLLSLAFAQQASAQNSTVSSLTGASALTGSELLYCVQGGADRKCTVSQIAPAVNYVSSSWFQPDHGLAVTGGSAVTSGTIYCVFGPVRAPVTIKNFQAKVTTLSVGNMQFGLYSVSGGTLTLVDSTANVSTGGTGNITGAPALTTDALSPSVLYAWCTNFSATPVLSSFAATSNGANAIIGSATQANTVGGASLVTGKSILQTFGTWPATITLSGMSDVTTTVLPQVGFQVN